MRDILRRALPDAEERIAWSMPTYWQVAISSTSLQPSTISGSIRGMLPSVTSRMSWMAYTTRAKAASGFPTAQSMPTLSHALPSGASKKSGRPGPKKRLRGDRHRLEARCLAPAALPIACVRSMLARIVLVEQMLGRREKLRVACHAGNLFDFHSMAACLGIIGAPCERPMATHKRSRYGPRPSPERSGLASPKPAAWYRGRVPPR